MRGAVTAALLVVACGGATSNEYTRALASAERAYSAGRYVEAAADWGRAEHLTPRASERDEAQYLRAAALARAGRDTDAMTAFGELISRSPRGARTPRALLDRALLKKKTGDDAGAFGDEDAIVRGHPDSGVARSALAACLESLRSRGEDAVRRYLDALPPSVASSELGEFVETGYAASLAASGDLEAAKGRYLRAAERYPYPKGRLWDDSLFHAAELSEKLGNAKEAIALLERLLGARESAYVQGSYERARYGEARYHLAELYRDALHDPVKARATFETLFREHPKSRLRDDAAWNAALLARDAGDGAAACRMIHGIVTEIPESRYAACATRLCVEEKPPEKSGACHEYLLRARASDAAGD